VDISLPKRYAEKKNKFPYSHTKYVCGMIAKSCLMINFGTSMHENPGAIRETASNVPS